MTARVVLDGIKARQSAATPGPWTVEQYECDHPRVRVTSLSDDDDYNLSGEVEPGTAAFIAAAPTDVARLTGAVEALLVLCDERQGWGVVSVEGIRAVIENALEGE